ncbi:MAG: hypothetical protein GWP08_02330 [Nitrospiraceae bacterium]|nr:hypothetical protein [Nitrospiraceae bacterium]
MKSAYELAMERLEKASGPTKKLTEEQRAAIADIEKVYEAKIAELKLSHEARLQGAATQEEFDALQAELAEKIRGFEERRDHEKEAIWNAD